MRNPTPRPAGSDWARPATFMDELDAIFRALASPWRRRILDLLRGRPHTTGELDRSLPDLSRFAVMQHLRVLEDAGLVVYVREGRHRFNYLNPVPIQMIYERWVKAYEKEWATALVDLKRRVEDMGSDEAEERERE